MFRNFLFCCLVLTSSFLKATCKMNSSEFSSKTIGLRAGMNAPMLNLNALFAKNEKTAMDSQNEQTVTLQSMEKAILLGGMNDSCLTTKTQEASDACHAYGVDIEKCYSDKLYACAQEMQNFHQMRIQLITDLDGIPVSCANEEYPYLYNACIDSGIETVHNRLLEYQFSTSDLEKKITEMSQKAKQCANYHLLNCQRVINELRLEKYRCAATNENHAKNDEEK